MKITNKGQHKLHFRTATGSYLVIPPGDSELDDAAWQQACQQFKGRADGPEGLIKEGTLAFGKSAPVKPPTEQAPGPEPDETPDKRWNHAHLLQYARDAGLDVDEQLSKVQLLAVIQEAEVTKAG